MYQQEQWHCSYSMFGKQQRGFTLVELLAVVAILTIITAVVLAGSSRGRGGILLTNASYEVAILIREAQTYGASAFKPGAIGVTASSPHGVFIDSGIVDSIILFRDVGVANGLYDSGVDEVLESLVFTAGNRMQEICWKTGASETCASSGATLSITFKRPNPDAKILGTGGASVCGAGCEYATIRIISPAGDTRGIQVYTTGQIAVLDT